MSWVGGFRGWHDQRCRGSVGFVDGVGYWVGDGVIGDGDGDGWSSLS